MISDLRIVFSSIPSILFICFKVKGECLKFVRFAFDFIAPLAN